MTVIVHSADTRSEQRTPRMTVLRADTLVTFQDRGRLGFAHFGVTRAGAADPASFRLANRITGNPEGYPALELTLGSFAGILTVGRWASLTGAPASVKVNGCPVANPYLFWIPARTPFEIGIPQIGLRSYFTVSGGFRAEPVLGSHSTDTLSGLGPPILRPRMELEVGEARVPAWNTDVAYFRVPIGMPTIRFRWGPRDALFSDDDKATLTTSSWIVSSESNRVGIRLAGPRLQCRHSSLPSEGTPLGAIQVPPSGQPIIFMPDHPVTGGYPVIGVVTDEDIGYLAQIRPGNRLALTPVQWNSAISDASPMR
jgi:biotin-dependent carboxylase-like uncharacterized protein